MTHTDEEIFNSIFQGFKPIQTKESITKDYVEGKITKEEFIRRMKEIEEIR